MSYLNLRCRRYLYLRGYSLLYDLRIRLDCRRINSCNSKIILNFHHFGSFSYDGDWVRLTFKDNVTLSLFNLNNWDSWRFSFGFWGWRSRLPFLNKVVFRKLLLCSLCEGVKCRSNNTILICYFRHKSKLRMYCYLSTGCNNNYDS